VGCRATGISHSRSATPGWANCYDCDVCGVSLDRDENAAINLRKLALAQLPEGLAEVTPVERKALASALARGETGLVEAGSDSERQSPFDS